VNAVAIAPDGTWLATGGGDAAMRIWDAASSEQRAVLTGHLDTVRAVAIAPDGTWLAAVAARSVRIWDRATGGISAFMRVDSLNNRSGSEPVYSIGMQLDLTGEPLHPAC
jgi:WD40 repeat protein